MNMEAIHMEDNIIDQLRKRVADLERSNTLLKKSKEQVDQAKDMYSIDEVCKRLSISKPTFYGLVKKNLAPRLTKLKGTRRQFVTQTDLDKWLEDEKNFVHGTLCVGVKRKALTPE